MLAFPPAQQPWQSIVMSPRLVQALLPCPTQGCVWRSPGACLVKSLMFYSRAFREEKRTQWFTDFAAAKTAILCSNKNPSVKRWTGSALLWATQSPQICVCEMFPPQHHPQALLCINPHVSFQKCSCKPSSLVVLRWSQLVQRHQLSLVSGFLQESRAFLLSPLRWGRKLSCFIEKIGGHLIELLKIRKTRL